MKVIKRKCPQNHACPAVNVCPVKAISQEGHALPIINKDICIKCKKCVDFCPSGAIKE